MLPSLMVADDEEKGRDFSDLKDFRSSAAEFRIALNTVSNLAKDALQVSLSTSNTVTP